MVIDYKPPTAGPMDWLSRMDNLLLEQRQAIQQILTAVTGAGPGAGNGAAGQNMLEYLYGIDVSSLVELRQRMEEGSYFPYQTASIDMTVAQTDKEYRIEGRSLAAWTDGTLTGVGIRLNSPQADLIYLDRFNPIKSFPFWKVYLTWPAQAGKTLQLFTGRSEIVVPDVTDAPVAALLEKLIPVGKARVFNEALPAADTDILTADVTPTNSPSYWRISACVSVAGVLSVHRTVGAGDVLEKLNGGTNLTADCLYTFSVPVRSGDSINLQYSATGGTISSLTVDEIGGAE